MILVGCQEIAIRMINKYIERIERILIQDLMETFPKADIQEEDAVWDSLDLVYERYGG